MTINCCLTNILKKCHSVGVEVKHPAVDDIFDD